MGSNKETVMDPGQVLVLLPLLSIVSGIPTFLKSSYLRCDDTACWHKTFDIEYSHVLHLSPTTRCLMLSSPSVMILITNSRTVVNMRRKVGLNLTEISPHPL